MIQQQMMEEIDRLARLCEAKDGEIKQLIESSHKSHDHANEEIRELETKIVMQAEALKVAYEYCPDDRDFDYIADVLSSTSGTVAAWRAKETEPLQVRLYRWAKTAGIFDANHLDKIQDELDELKESYSDEMEMADVLLALLLHAEQMGCLDLLAAAEKKFAIIQCRKYGDPDERGVVRHIDRE